MDDREKMLSFLCAERQRVEDAFHFAADRAFRDLDVYTFDALQRAQTKMLYFREIESKVDALLHLYDDVPLDLNEDLPY